MTKPCVECGTPVAPRRSELGYTTCMPCGEQVAIKARSTWCVAPMHKSNYMLITNPADLLGLNNKGGIIK